MQTETRVYKESVNYVQSSMKCLPKESAMNAQPEPNAPPNALIVYSLSRLALL